MGLLDSILGAFAANGSMGGTAPDTQPGGAGGPGDGPGGSGGFAAAAGINNPDRFKAALAALGGGLSAVRNSPFAGEVAANAAGGALAGGNKAEDTAINQALKLQQIKQRGAARGKMVDEATDPSILLKRADAASEQWYRDRVAALRDELRGISQSAQTLDERIPQYKSLRNRATALGAEFENIKTQNRRAHGLSDDGTPLPQGAESAAPESGFPASSEQAADQ